MSICTYAFLGENIEDLDLRVARSLEDIGFAMQMHPEMRLLETPSCDCLYLQLQHVPSHLKRVRRDTPLLVSFEYQVTKQDGKIFRKDGWPPRGIRQYTYQVSTRTASGRSQADFYMQALIAAILAKETGGYFYVDAQEIAVPGQTGLDRILKELNSPSNMEFDADAFPFEGWPPATHKEPFSWPSPIKSIVLQQALEFAKPPKQKTRLSLTWIAFMLMVLYLFVMVMLNRGT